MDVMDKIEIFYDATWWLSDISFAIGMFGALNPTLTRSKLEGFFLVLYERFVLSGKPVPQHLQKSLNKQSAKWTYRFISFFMLAAMAHTLGYNLFGSSTRSPIINLIQFFYCSTAVFISVDDILLDDDKSEWSLEAKRRHVIWPIDLESNKIFPTALSGTDVQNQMYSIKASMQDHLINLLFWSLSTWFSYRIAPPIVFAIFLSWQCFFVHNNLLKVLDLAYDAFNLTVFKNRYEHLFGDMWVIVTKGEEHDYFGKQYQYFNYACKPLEKLCKKQFYDKARKQYGANVAEAKAAYYLGRGGVVIATLFVLNMLNKYNAYVGKDSVLSLAKAVLPFVAYYAIHAGVAYRNQGVSDWYDADWKRFFFAFIPDAVVAGTCFYMPLLDRVFKEHIPAA